MSFPADLRFAARSLAKAKGLDGHRREMGGGRIFVHAGGDPYALVAPITRIIRELSAEQPVERAATLEDVRTEVLAPERLNALVFGGFAQAWRS